MLLTEEISPVRGGIWASLGGVGGGLGDWRFDLLKIVSRYSPSSHGGVVGAEIDTKLGLSRDWETYRVALCYYMKRLGTFNNELHENLIKIIKINGIFNLRYYGDEIKPNQD